MHTTSLENPLKTANNHCQDTSQINAVRLSFPLVTSIRGLVGLNTAGVDAASRVVSNSPVSVLHKRRGFFSFSATRPSTLKINGSQPPLPNQVSGMQPTYGSFAVTRPVPVSSILVWVRAAPITTIDLPSGLQ